MAKQTITIAFTALIFFIAGAACRNYNLYKTCKLDRKIIQAQNKALDKAEKIIDNNLLDTDGSDTMSEYMNACNKVHVLYTTQK